MNNNEITTPCLDEATEQKMKLHDAEIKELAKKIAIHFAKRNQPHLKGDKLNQYIDELKAGYEKLAAEIIQVLQPGANFPEAKADAEYFKEKDAELVSKINALHHENQNDEYELEDFNPSVIHRRIVLTTIITFIILIGETIFNTKALQVTGENLLFAFVLSVCISFAVFMFSHFAPFFYKHVKKVWQKRLVVVGSLALVTGLFTALAIFRSTYLAIHDVHISPFYFVIINLFFFIVSAIISYFLLPTWEEIQENASRLKIYFNIQKRKDKITELQNERDEIKRIVLARTKQRIRILHCTNAVMDRIRSMYREAVAIFIRTNRAYRSDHGNPDCFSEIVSDLNSNENSSNQLNP